jgi:phosphoadenosine phosphosulfate reductase
MPRDLAPTLDEKDALGILSDAMDSHRGRIALVSSFGAESAVLLHLVARLDPLTPVLFLETGMLFPETLSYQHRLTELLGLADVRVIRPESSVATEDIHRTDPDACCAMRKTLPLEKALGPFSAWITGRKRFHGGRRIDLPIEEPDATGRLKINPLAAWTARDIDAYFSRHPLPRHPLVKEGFASIGCAPCTTRTRVGEAARAGRWRGRAKTECGIHFSSLEGRWTESGATT